jgi:MerR family transcriptional regulator, aldehyde-responsive regulator
MSLSIKEVSEKLGIPAHTIRFYEKEGLLPEIKRDEHGNRMFEQKDVDWMLLMGCFRSTGMPISDLKHFVELTLKGTSTLCERITMLTDYKRDLVQKQQDSQRSLDVVNYKLALYESIQNGEAPPDAPLRMTHHQESGNVPKD